MMKTNVLATAVLAFVTISGAAANPASLPMGVEVIEQDGVTLVREVVRFSAFVWRAKQLPC